MNAPVYGVRGYSALVLRSAHGVGVDIEADNDRPARDYVCASIFEAEMGIAAQEAADNDMSRRM